MTAVPTLLEKYPQHVHYCYYSELGSSVMMPDMGPVKMVEEVDPM